MKFRELSKLKEGDQVAIVSPSFAAPSRWPQVHELGLRRLREVFGLKPVEFPTTRKLGAPRAERAKDLIAAFENTEIKAVIATIGGDDQITYVKNLPSAPFSNNPKPFFGISDNTHFINHLWLCGVPAYYGGALFTEFAMQSQMDDLTVNYLKQALFEGGLTRLSASPEFNDIGLDWNDPETLMQRRRYQESEGWYWDGAAEAEGVTWGGCVESVDELLRHGVQIPDLDEFDDIVLFFETSEEIPPREYVFRVFRALGERGILARAQGLLMGRPKAWEFGKENSDDAKVKYKKDQREAIVEVVRQYNSNLPIVQNLDFGHTSPTLSLPVGRKIKISPREKSILVEY